LLLVITESAFNLVALFQFAPHYGFEQPVAGSTRGNQNCQQDRRISGFQAVAVSWFHT